MSEKRRILITGGRGYLATQLIGKLEDDPMVEQIIDIDLKNEYHYWIDGKVYHYRGSILDDFFLRNIMRAHKIDTVVHTVWTFDPSHDKKAQYNLDVNGSIKVLECAMEESVENFVYLGSTTAYGQIPENNHPLKEEEWTMHSKKRLNSKYLYAKHKAEFDWLLQLCMMGIHRIMNSSKSKMKICLLRGAIVLGKNTPNNIVAYVAKSPFTFGRYMFKVWGHNPDMQFWHEDDCKEVLYRAVMEKWSGIVNAASRGSLPYTEVIRLLGRKKFELPAWMLYGACGLLWKLDWVTWKLFDKRAFRFPPELIDTIKERWDANISRLEEKYNCPPAHTSKEAVLDFASTL